MKEYIDTIIGLAGIVAIIWRLATTKAEIYRQIERNRDDLEDLINESLHQFELKLIDYADKKNAQKTEIDKNIEALKHDLSEKITAYNYEFKLHLIEYTERKEFITYRFNGHDEMITHKFNRCWDSIKEIQAFLSRSTGYIVRDRESE